MSKLNRINRKKLAKEFAKLILSFQPPYVKIPLKKGELAIVRTESYNGSMVSGSTSFKVSTGEFFQLCLRRNSHQSGGWNKVVKEFLIISPHQFSISVSHTGITGERDDSFKGEIFSKEFKTLEEFEELINDNWEDKFLVS